MSSVVYHFVEVPINIKNRRILNKWIREVVLLHKRTLDSLSIILCTDTYLYELNKKYLMHDYYTDIITFDNSEDDKIISGDLFISLDRLVENAKTYSVAIDTELCRLIIHGVLHLCGFSDRSVSEKETMTQLENLYLANLGNVPRGTFVLL